MALIFTETAQGVIGDKRYWIGTVAFDDSYDTGGETVAAANFGFQSAIDTVIAGAGSALVHGFVVKYDPSTSKLAASTVSGTPAAASGNLSTVVDVPVFAIGE